MPAPILINVTHLQESKGLRLSRELVDLVDFNATSVRDLIREALTARLYNREKVSELLSTGIEEID